MQPLRVMSFNMRGARFDDGTNAYRVFATAGYDDTFALAGNRSPVDTFHGFEGSAFVSREGTPLQIDWVLLRQGAARLTPTSSQVINDAAPPLYPSDHYPILVGLTTEPV